MSRTLAKVTCLLAGAAALTLGTASLAGGVPAVTLHPIGGVLHKANALEALPEHGGTATSTNWSGYAVQTSDITAVSSTFTVPTAGLILPGFAATWTGIGGYSTTDLIQAGGGHGEGGGSGIGGYSTTDLIQAGVAEQSFPSTPLLGDQYYAWYELLPNSETQLTNCVGNSACTVSPGDTVSVNIVESGSEVWTISVNDGSKWSWSDTQLSYKSSNSSAEWILEAPQIDDLPTLVAGVGTMHFGPTSTFTVGSGSPQPIAAGNPTKITMSSPVGIINFATPSALAPDGESFNVCAYTFSSSCAAP
jgi:hypothetical protein